MAKQQFQGKKSNKASFSTAKKSTEAFTPADINPNYFTDGLEAVQEQADVEQVAEASSEPEMTELNDDVPPAVTEVEQVNVEQVNVEQVIQEDTTLVEEPTLIEESTLEAVQPAALVLEKVIEAVQPKAGRIFNLQTRGYKQTAIKFIETNYALKQGETAIANSLQKDPGRCAKIHLAHIMFTITEQKGFKQVKTPGSWCMVMDQNFENSVKQHEDYKAMEDLGFRYDNNSKITSFYIQDAKVEKLQEYNPEYLQQMYDKILNAADESHRNNSKNNQFTINNYQNSSFLHELNKIYDMVEGIA